MSGPEMEGIDRRDVRVMSTEMVAEGTRVAVQRKYNRRLTSEELGAIDPEGIHLAWVMLLHEHAQGVAVPVHYRCQVMLKLREREEPYEMLLDLDIDFFKSLPTVQSVREAMAAAEQSG